MCVYFSYGTRFAFAFVVYFWFCTITGTGRVPGTGYGYRTGYPGGVTRTRTGVWAQQTRRHSQTHNTNTCRETIVLRYIIVPRTDIQEAPRFIHDDADHDEKRRPLAPGPGRARARGRGEDSALHTDVSSPRRPGGGPSARGRRVRARPLARQGPR